MLRSWRQYRSGLVGRAVCKVAELTGLLEEGRILSRLGSRTM